MQTITIKVPLNVRHTVLTPLGPSMFSRVEAEYNGASVIIVGMRDVVDGMISAGVPSDPPSLIQRALSALGYVVGDHQKDVEQFSQWVDHLTTFRCSDEVLDLWTGAVLARLSAKWTVDAAIEDAQLVIAQRMRLFPPAPKAGLDDGPMLPDARTELQEWRSAAKSLDVSSPEELASITNLSFGELLERKIRREWREETGQETPDLAGKRIASLVNDVHSLTQRVGSLLDERTKWREKTNCDHPSEFDGEMIYLRRTRDETDREIRAWKKATERQTPDLARSHISQLENRNAKLMNDIRIWQKATGADSPESAINTIGASFDSWKEATGCANAFQAQKKISELEARLLSYASEIDALRKANVREPVAVDIVSNGRVIGVATKVQMVDAEHEKRVTAERELAKVRAELDSKRRECQTEKDRADENAREMIKRGVLLDKIAEALGRDFNHESLPEHVADLKRTESETEQYAKKLRDVLHAREDEGLIDAAKRAIIPLPKPKKVEAGQKWAFVMIATSGPDNGSPLLAGRFKNAWGHHYGALVEDAATGFFLGT